MYVWKLLKKLKEFNITLAAGEGGLNRTVRWYHIAEDTSIADFIIGNEIIFTTGIELGENQDKIIEFIDALYSHGTSGIIINCGKYIKKIPEQVIKYCDEIRLPLFEIPWTEKLVNVGRAVSAALLEDERFRTNMQNAMSIALLVPNQSKANRALFNEYGFKENKFYGIVVGDITNVNKNNASELVNKIRDNLVNITSCVFITHIEKKLVVIMANLNKEILDREVDIILNVAGKITSSGRSEVKTGIRNISKYYKQAEADMVSRRSDVSDALKINEQYKILLEIKDKDKIEEYCDNVIGAVLKWDNKNNANYYETLKCYFENDASVSKAAQEMNIHRNTINYKIKKIESLLNCDLSSFEERFSIMLAMKLRELYPK
ncbi:MAG: PucR family transcriptional regulator [Clostridia bacterium]|nr:PucR family transcriptional regulator [Clostridia bacterium]